MRKFCAALLMTFCLLQVGVTVTLAQVPEPGFTSLSLLAESEKDAFTSGVPITIKVRLANLTQTEIAAQRDLNPAYGTLQVYVSHNGGEFKRYLGPGWGTKDPPAVSPDLIPPGYYVSREITLLFNNEVSGRVDLLASSLPFNEAGSYAIRVELYDETFGQRIVAPTIGLQIRFPQEEAGQAIWEAVKANSKLAYFMQTGDARQADSVIKKAEQLVAGHPDNVYEKHLALALGRHYLKEDQIETSIVHLKEAATAEPASPLRAQALLELTNSYVRKGDIEEAIRISDAAGDEFDEGEVRYEFQRLSSKFRRLGKSPSPR
jgi:tetratricopeptide (TPR) repeat protein